MSRGDIRRQETEELLGQTTCAVPYLGQTVKRDESETDMVMVFPMKLSEAELTQLSASEQKKHQAFWAQEIKGCRKIAEQVFLRREQGLCTSDAKLDAAFPEVMSRLDFQTKMMQSVVDTLCGHRCGFHVHTMKSADKDEVFVCISTPANGQVVRAIADSEAYRMPVAKKSYANVLLIRDDPATRGKLPQVLGQDCPAYVSYDAAKAERFEGFREVDKLRMLNRRVQRFLDLAVMKREQIITQFFVTHQWDSLVKLRGFASLGSCWRLPLGRNLERCRDYFGEEYAFFFHWFGFYTFQLLTPAILGIILFSRYFIGLDNVTRNLIQDGYAIFMALWAANFCASYKEQSIKRATLWGTRNYDTVASIRPDFVESKSRVAINAYKGLGTAIISTFLVTIVCFVIIIQTMRKTMMVHPDQVMLTQLISAQASPKIASKVGAKMGAVLITVQIKVLDFIWGRLAVFITNRENHKTTQRWQASLIYKTFIVKFFNGMYPFVYYSFAKEYVEGCPSGGPRGCIPGLQVYIGTYFVTHVATVVGLTVLNICMTRRSINQELSKPGVSRENYTYLQLQAKCSPAEPGDMLDDYMELVVQFALVCCFTVALPILTLLALLSNMVEYRLIAVRSCYVMQRVRPTGAEGIGAWYDLLVLISYLAIAINAGLGIFAMRPFKDVELVWKLCMFLLVEHVLVFLKVAVESAFVAVPHDVDMAEDKNQDNLPDLLTGDAGYKPIKFETRDLPVGAPIKLHPDHQKFDSQLHTPFHLIEAWE